MAKKVITYNKLGVWSSTWGWESLRMLWIGVNDRGVVIVEIVWDGVDKIGGVVACVMGIKAIGVGGLLSTSNEEGIICKTIFLWVPRVAS